MGRENAGTPPFPRFLREGGDFDSTLSGRQLGQVNGRKMKIIVLAVACLLSLTNIATAQEKQAEKSTAIASVLEAKVRKVWEDFKTKNKASLGAALADDFRLFEEGTSGFGDKKADLATVDELELISYTLKDFTVKSLGPSAALVTYVAHYESKSGGQVAKADSVFGEVWAREGNDWKALYLQETYIQGTTGK